MRLPIALNALFNPLASEFIPAVAANATKAIIRTYSTRPCPDSSLCRRASERDRKVCIDSLLRVFLLESQPAGMTVGDARNRYIELNRFILAHFRGPCGHFGNCG